MGQLIGRVATDAHERGRFLDREKQIRSVQLRPFGSSLSSLRAWTFVPLLRVGCNRRTATGSDLLITALTYKGRMQQVCCNMAPTATYEGRLSRFCCPVSCKGRMSQARCNRLPALGFSAEPSPFMAGTCRGSGFDFAGADFAGGLARRTMRGTTPTPSRNPPGSNLRAGARGGRQSVPWRDDVSRRHSVTARGPEAWERR